MLFRNELCLSLTVLDTFHTLAYAADHGTGWAGCAHRAATTRPRSPLSKCNAELSKTQGRKPVEDVDAQ